MKNLELESLFDNIYDTVNTQDKKDMALCNICAKTYATKAYLKDHMSTHEKEKLYKSALKKDYPAE